MNDYVHSLIREELGISQLRKDNVLSDTIGEAIIIADEDMVVSGMKIVQEIVKILDDSIYLKVVNNDGVFIEKDTIIAILSGDVGNLLQLQQLLKNTIQHMSAMATLTSRYTSNITNATTRICDSRDTIPGARVLEQMAFVDGGGVNHRSTYHGQNIITPLHIAKAGSIQQAIQFYDNDIDHDSRIEVEIDTYEQFIDAERSTCDIIVLRNMKLFEIRRCVISNHSHKLLIASGFYAQQEVPSLCDTGIDFIAITNLFNQSTPLQIQIKINI